MLFIILAVAAFSGVRADTHWSYEHQKDWVEVSATCDGKAQSPIDVKTHGAKVHKGLKIHLSNYEKALEAGKFTFANNGHSAQLTLTEGATTNDWAPKVKIGENEYQFTQLHFHWDANNNFEGSEHAIDGRRHALELHLVHFNTRYNSTSAGNFKDGLAVLAVLFDASPEDNKHFDVITKSLNKITVTPATSDVESSVTLSHFLPQNPEKFFQYQGSLTTPPCSEAVVWIIFPEIQKIGANQLKAYRSLESADKKHLSVVRNLQALNGREVFASFECEREHDHEGNHVENRVEAPHRPEAVRPVPARPQAPLAGLRQEAYALNDVEKELNNLNLLEAQLKRAEQERLVAQLNGRQSAQFGKLGAELRPQVREEINNEAKRVGLLSALTGIPFRIIAALTGGFGNFRVGVRN